MWDATRHKQLIERQLAKETKWRYRPLAAVDECAANSCNAAVSGHSQPGRVGPASARIGFSKSDPEQADTPKYFADPYLLTPLACDTKPYTDAAVIRLVPLVEFDRQRVDVWCQLPPRTVPTLGRPLGVYGWTIGAGARAIPIPHPFPHVP